MVLPRTPDQLDRQREAVRRGPAGRLRAGEPVRLAGSVNTKSSRDDLPPQGRDAGHGRGQEQIDVLHRLQVAAAEPVPVPQLLRHTGPVEL